MGGMQRGGCGGSLGGGAVGLWCGGPTGWWKWRGVCLYCVTEQCHGSNPPKSNSGQNCSTSSGAGKSPLTQSCEATAASSSALAARLPSLTCASALRLGSSLHLTPRVATPTLAPKPASAARFDGQAVRPPPHCTPHTCWQSLRAAPTMSSRPVCREMRRTASTADVSVVDKGASGEETAACDLVASSSLRPIVWSA